MTDRSGVRPLAILLGAQLVLVAALLVWAAVGFPLPGAITGVVVFRYLETVTALGDLRLLITGTGLLLVLYALPGGFGQVMLNVRDRYLKWVAERREIVVPSLVADKRVEGVAEHAADEAGLLEGALTDEGEDVEEPEPVGAGR